MPSKSIVWAWIYYTSHNSELLSDTIVRTFIQCCSQFSIEIQNNLFSFRETAVSHKASKTDVAFTKMELMQDLYFSLYFCRLVYLHLCAEKKKCDQNCRAVCLFLLCKKYIYEFTCVKLAMTYLIIHYVVLDFSFS